MKKSPRALLVLDFPSKIKSLCFSFRSSLFSSSSYFFTMRVGVTVPRASASASASSRPVLALSQRQPPQAAMHLLRRPIATPLSSSAVVSSARPRRRSNNLLVVRAAASFDSLSNSLSKAWDSIRIDGKLTAENIKGPMREIRRALLEADVSFYFIFRSSAVVFQVQCAPFSTLSKLGKKEDTSMMVSIQMEREIKTERRNAKGVSLDQKFDD